MADINAIAEQIQGLTLLEASQLVKLLEEKLGVSAAAAALARRRNVKPQARRQRAARNASNIEKGRLRESWS